MNKKKESENAQKLRNLMLGALYKMGDPNYHETLLDAWELSNIYTISLVYYLGPNEIPAVFDKVT